MRANVVGAMYAGSSNQAPTVPTVLNNKVPRRRLDGGARHRPARRGRAAETGYTYALRTYTQQSACVPDSPSKASGAARTRSRKHNMSANPHLTGLRSCQKQPPATATCP
jgi:hypothetical protein|eukprot:COSAG06_NODE_1336_length_9822_cov_2.335905_6_plen_110_part_00